MNFTAYVPSLRGIDYGILGIGDKSIQNSKLNNWGLGTGDWELSKNLPCLPCLPCLP